MSLTFKQFVKEVAEPKAGDEKRFKDKHVVQAIDHPSNDKETLNGTKKSPSKAKRKADYEKDEDAYVYEEMMKCPHCDEEYEKGKRHNCDMKEDDDDEDDDDEDDDDDDDDEMEESKKEDDPPFTGGHKARTYKDRFGNVVKTKNIAKHLAKKELAKQKVKEEVDLDETNAQKKKREDIIMGMKKNSDELKRRYGDKWRSVMYATATKKVQEEVKLDEAILDYDNFVGKGKEMWKVTWSGSSGRGAGGLKRTTGMSGIPVGSSEDDVKKIWQKKNKDKKFISAKKVGIREEVELDEGDKVTVKPKGNSRYFTIIKTTNTKSYPIGDEISDDDISMMQSDGKVKVDIKESTELDGVFKAGSMKLNDGSSVKLSSDDASALNELFKSLNSNNKSKMKQILNQSKKGYNEILSFAKAM